MNLALTSYDLHPNFRQSSQECTSHGNIIFVPAIIILIQSQVTLSITRSNLSGHHWWVCIKVCLGRCRSGKTIVCTGVEVPTVGSMGCPLACHQSDFFPPPRTLLLILCRECHICHAHSPSFYTLYSLHQK